MRRRLHTNERAFEVCATPGASPCAAALANRASRPASPATTPRHGSGMRPWYTTQPAEEREPTAVTIGPLEALCYPSELPESVIPPGETKVNAAGVSNRPHCGRGGRL